MAALSKREWWTGFTVAMIFFTLAFVAPGPLRRIVAGQEVVETVIGGYVVSKWLLVTVGGITVALLWLLIYRLSLTIWPEKPVQPPYEPPIFPVEMSAEAFLGTRPPYSFAELHLGSEEKVTAIRKFIRARDQWLRAAPESTLADLPRAAEAHLDNDVECEDNETIDALLTANQLRGIPTLQGLFELDSQVSHMGFMEALMDYSSYVDSQPGKDSA